MKSLDKGFRWKSDLLRLYLEVKGMVVFVLICDEGSFGVEGPWVQELMVVNYLAIIIK